jgi:hypothetical protein
MQGVQGKLLLRLIEVEGWSDTMMRTIGRRGEAGQHTGCRKQNHGRMTNGGCIRDVGFPLHCLFVVLYYSPALCPLLPLLSPQQQI